MGVSASLGNRRITSLIFACNSLNATSISLDSSNFTTTTETPAREEELTSSMPEILLTADSIIFVTEASIISGSPPGKIVVTDSTGNSISGIRSTPIRL